MPYRIETARRCRDRRKEGIAQPDDEDGILLSQGLSALQSETVLAANPLAKGKLKDAGY